jgi:hypothetical protein
MTDEQVSIIGDFVNTEYWDIKMANDKDDTKFVKDLLEKYEL